MSRDPATVTWGVALEGVQRPGGALDGSTVVYIANSPHVMGYLRLLMGVAADLTFSLTETGTGWTSLSVLGTGWRPAADLR